MGRLNQVSGLVALAAVACMVFFGGAGDRAVSPATAQPSAGGGGTVSPITLGNCNRCAWNYKHVELDVQPGQEYVLIPAGTSGAIRFTSWAGAFAWRMNAASFDPFATGEWSMLISPEMQGENGIRFYDGITLKYEGQSATTASVFFQYRLD